MLPSLQETLNRHFIGLDHMHRLASAQTTNYPPFNIEQVDDNNYVLSLAVAGFQESEIEISLLNSTLTISGSKPKTDDNDVAYLHRGLSFRDFSRQFSLGEHIQVLSAEMSNGMLTISLERQVPESAKAKRIPIGKSPVVGQVEHYPKVVSAAGFG